MLIRLILFIFGISMCANTVFAGKNESYKTFASKCSKCHGLEIIEKKHKTKEQWKETIKRMERYGANFEGKQNIILEYLVNKK